MQSTQKRHAVTVLRREERAIPTVAILLGMRLLSATLTVRQLNVSTTRNVRAMPARSVWRGAMPASAGRQNVPHLTVDANKVS